MEHKLYVTVRKRGFTLKSSTGATVFKSVNKNDAYTNTEKALKECAKHTRGRVYVFCDDRELVKTMNGPSRIRDAKVLRRIINVKALEPIFESVRFFYFQIDKAKQPPD